jgi:hypothetical protein
VVIKNSKNRATLCNTHKREQKEGANKVVFKSFQSWYSTGWKKKQPKRRAKKVVF